MCGELCGEKVIIHLTNPAIAGYGRKKGGEDKIELSLEEAAFLLERGKITVIIKNEKEEEGRKEGEEKQLIESVEKFLKTALDISPRFGIRYIVYVDLKERGYAVMPGMAAGVDFWLYSRGSKPGENSSRYFIHVLSEREAITMNDLVWLLSLAHNMRKEPIVAVVDEESEITYYEIKEAKFCSVDKDEIEKWVKRKAKATLLGDRVILWNEDVSVCLHNDSFYGKLNKEQLQLSLVEAAYLMKNGGLQIEANGAPMSFAGFIEHAATVENDFKDKYAVYEDLRDKGLIAKTGFKFGSHFRVYEYEYEIEAGTVAGAEAIKINREHSSCLLHVVPKEHVFTPPELSRAVRLAHSVKKRMIFAYREEKNKKREKNKNINIKYVDIGRKKL
jgi:tRNA-intron endonuclease